MITQETIKIDRLLLNAGQIAGVPKNPRFIRDNEYEKLKQSIADYPEMLEAREVVAVPYGDKYVVIGGNMRLRACRELGYKELPVKIYPEDTDPKKLRHFVLIDNKSYGSDDWDCIVNEWDEGELQEWGVETPEEWMNEESDQNTGERSVEICGDSWFLNIEFESESETQQLYDKLTMEGYKCKIIR